jgi:polar amino acid transport system permease protein
VSWQLFWLLVEAARLTVLLSVVSIAGIGFLLATLVCAGMLSANRTAAGAARLFVSFFRGTPLLVQLLLIYYLLPRIGLDVPSYVAAIAGMSFCTAAYQAEIMRGGFAGVPAGLVEAADMCGLSRVDTFRRIRLPIAFKLTLPGLVNEAIMMLKSSSLVSVVGVVELTRMAQDLAASTYRPLELYAAAGFIYLIINLVVAALGRGLEARLSWGRM